MTAFLKPSRLSLNPAYQWPHPVKKIILTGAVILCAGVYALLAVGIVAMLVLAVSAAGG